VRIWVIAPFVTLPGEPGFNRFSYIAGRLAERGHTVTLWTSSFSHCLKRQREAAVYDVPYEVRLISEPGYGSNTSIKRPLSHLYLARQLRYQQMLAEYTPDVMYVGFPPVAAAMWSVTYGQRHHIPVVLDIQDLWPEAFQMLVGKRFRWLVRLLMKPVEGTANAIYRGATQVIAVSSTFSERAVRSGARGTEAVYIGTDLPVFDDLGSKRSASFAKVDSDELWLTYVGTLSHSYDFDTLLGALGLIPSGIRERLRIQVAGDGPHLSRVRERVRQEGLDGVVRFHGFLPYGDMAALLVNSDAGLNIIREGSATSLPNKVFDYLAAGLPIINSVDGELAGLISQYEFGVNYRAGNQTDLAGAIVMLVENSESRSSYGKNARRFAERHCDRAVTYERILSLVEESRTGGVPEVAIGRQR
jgi:glycosyltransferase involved in cell wall biosynthesis